MIDNKLISAHQWVVDETQKKPGWWAEHAIMAATAIDFARRALTWESGWDAVWMLLGLVVATMLVAAARTPILLKSIGASSWIRGFFLALVALNLFMLFTAAHVGINMLDLVSSSFMLSYYCFAACDNPRPPKRNEKLVPHAA